MEYSRLIHDYLEGELPVLLEDKLFAEMALNQDLRGELNKQIKIHLITKNEMNSITIPSDATNAVFSGLGFSIPSAASTSAFYRFRQDFSIKKYARYFISFTALLLIGFFIYNTDDKSNDNVLKAEINSSLALSQQSKNLNSFPLSSSTKNEKQEDLNNSERNSIISNFDNFSHNSNPVLNGKIPAEVSAKEIAIADNGNEFKNASESPFANNIMPLTIKHSDYEISEKTFKGNSQYLIGSTNFYNYINNASQEPLGIDITWNKANYNINRPKNLSEDSKSFVLGSNFSLMYNIDEKHAIGFEMGEETFSQEFEYYNGEQMTTYNRAPNYFWYAASYKYTADLEIISGLKPYGKISLGGARGGVLAKSQLGLTWNFSPGFSFNLGGEFGTLFYNINKNLYHSDKFSIMYGLTMHL